MRSTFRRASLLYHRAQQWFAIQFSHQDSWINGSLRRQGLSFVNRWCHVGLRTEFEEDCLSNSHGSACSFSGYCPLSTRRQRSSTFPRDIADAYIIASIELIVDRNYLIGVGSSVAESPIIALKSSFLPASSLSFSFFFLSLSFCLSPYSIRKGPSSCSSYLYHRQPWKENFHIRPIHIHVSDYFCVAWTNRW